MNKRKLSLAIVIPVFNEEEHLENCLESIAAQSVLPDEVIIVDNNCTDSSVSIAKKFAFVRVVSESRPGIVHARNAGFNAAKTDIVGRIDADTILPVNWVKDAKQFISLKPDNVLTGGCYLYDLGFPRFSGWVTENFSFRVNRIIIGSYIAWGSNLVFRRQLWLDVKDKVIIDNDIHEDIDLGIHMVEAGYKITYDKNRKVGVDSRIFSEQRRTREQHYVYLKRWPNTLKRHNLKRAWMGDVGAFIVYNLYYPLQVTHRLVKMIDSRRVESFKELG